MSCGRVCEKTDPGASINPTTRNKNKHNMRISLLNISLLTSSYCDLLERLERFERLELPGVNPIDWTAKRRNLEYRSNEFLGSILYSDSLRLAVFLAKEVLGRSSD